jgi:hypothetical protein
MPKILGRIFKEVTELKYMFLIKERVSESELKSGKNKNKTYGHKFEVSEGSYQDQDKRNAVHQAQYYQARFIRIFFEYL